MQAPIGSTPETGAAAEPVTRFRVAKALLDDRIAVGGIVLLAIVVIFAALGPYLSPYKPESISLFDKYQPPSWHHPLGTDFFGRDVMTRLMYGIRISFAVALVTESIALTVGVTIGLIGSYYGGAFDDVAMRITDSFLSFPAILLALAIMAVRGPGFANLVFALLLKEWTGYARLVRSEVLSIRESEYVLAARASGTRNRRIMWRHILPNASGTIVVFATLALPTPILAEAALSFLGLGLPIDTPSLGNMINVDHGYMRYAWWAVTFPGLAIALTVLGFNLIGDGLRDALDPRLQT
ncbi:MAG TPA: peptide ABC transporter permease [Chloroflexi bacterium]|jgi:peptide/nickel transport system permease protein|nr:peptide ABC transporter permease [Chloroflexota bacterium]